MHILVTVDKNWGIGKGQNTFVTIPEVEMLLRKETKGKRVVMSKSVAKRFPGGLSGDRENLILTRDLKYAGKNFKAIASIEELPKDDDTFVIGGESIFKQLLPFTNIVDVTYLNYKYDADAYFPNLDLDAKFKLVIESEEKTFFDLEYVFRRYERIKDE